MSPIDAERAFAADAQRLGQWTAFAKWSADDAVMFVPQPANAHQWLKDRANPAKAVEWWPTASYISCDGSLAVNTGGWRRPDGGVGYFSTVWKRQADGGWKWIIDGGDTLVSSRSRPRTVKSTRASCNSKGELDIGGNVVAGDGSDDFSMSTDRTLNSGWRVAKDGSRYFFASIWNGRRWQRVIEDDIPAAK